MDKLIKNMTSIFGARGREWLNNLPSIVRALSGYWGLTDLKPVENMSFNYVVKATYRSKDVVLKISCDRELIRDEKETLEYFNGCGSIALLDYNEEFNALLLQQALPGITLKSHYPTKADFVIETYASTVSNLHRPLVHKPFDRHISDWLKALDNISSNQIPSKLLKRAITLRDKLLATLTREIILHGDLHQENVLEDRDKWLTIDPKGIIGEPEFEVAAFDFIHPTELETKLLIRQLFEERVQHISRHLNLDPQRVQEWVFVRIVLSAAWSIEDQGDPSSAIRLADSLFNV